MGAFVRSSAASHFSNSARLTYASNLPSDPNKSIFVSQERAPGTPNPAVRQVLGLRPPSIPHSNDDKQASFGQPANLQTVDEP